MKFITPATNNVEFIELQYNSFKKYVKIAYEFIVFNDGKNFPDWTNYGDATMRDRIETKCKQLGIACINIPNDHHITEHRAGKRHLDTITFMTSYMFKNPDIYFSFDSDMFLISDFDDKKFENYDCAVVKQYNSGFEYVWPNLFYFNIPKLKFKEYIDWDGARGSDTGGKMEKWLELYKSNGSIYIIKHLISCTWNTVPIEISNVTLTEFLVNDVRNKNGNFWCELFDTNILHYRAGSNWNGEGEHVHKLMTTRLVNLLSSI